MTTSRQLMASSQIFLVNRMLTIGREMPAPDVVERTVDSECRCRKAGAPIEEDFKEGTSSRG